MQLARAMHMYGTPAHDLERSLYTVATKLGLEAEFFSTPTSLMVGTGHHERQRVRLMRVYPGNPNLGHLSAVEAITRDVTEGRATPQEGLKRVEALRTSAPRWPNWLQLVAFVLASAAVATFLRVRTGSLFIALVLGLLAGLVTMLTQRVPRLTHVTVALASIVVTTVAFAFDALTGRDSGYLTSLAGLVVLFPGLTFTVALTELSTGHLASGTARIAGAMVTFLGLGFGLALGARFGGVVGQGIVEMAGEINGPWMSAMSLPTSIEWLGAVIAPLAFMVLLNAEARDAGWILVSCLIAYATARFTTDAFGDQLASFVSAAVVTALSNILARLRGSSAMVTAVPGLLILVPGSIGFRSVSSMIGAEVEAGIATAFHVAMIGISLAAGIVAGSVFTSDPDRPQE